MTQKFSRNVLTRVNKFQKRFLLPVLIPCITLSLIALFCLTYFCYLADQATASPYYDWDRSLSIVAVPWFLFTFSILVFIVALWACSISNKIVGPYNRMIVELDRVIEGKGEKKIKVRKDDEMYDEIIKRVNILLDKMTKLEK